MDKYEVTFVLDGVINPLIMGKISSDIVITKYPNDDKLFAAVVTVDADSDEDSIPKSTERLENILNIYCLCSMDPIHISHARQIDSKKLSSGEILSRIEAYHIKRPFNKSTYDRILQDYVSTITSKNNKYFRITMHYFRMGRIEYYLGNAFIDYFVSLEALYSKDEERTEIKYRITNRIASLLGKDLQDRKEILLKARDLYDIRSGLVHGSKDEAKIEDVGKILGWLIESIFRFIMLSNKYSNHNEIIDKIDLGMIDNTVKDKIRAESEELFKSSYL